MYKLMFVLMLVLPACEYSVKIQHPVNNSAVNNPVALDVWLHNAVDRSSFRAKLDGVDITSAFSITPNHATATSPDPNLSPGVQGHTLEVSADLTRRNLFAPVQVTDDHITFVIQGPAPPSPTPSPSFSLEVTAPNQNVVWGDPVTYEIQVVGHGNFQNAVNLSLQLQPLQGIVPVGFQPSFNPPQVHAGQMSRLTISTFAQHTTAGHVNLQIRGTSPGVSDQTAILNLYVQRSQGPFSHVEPSPNSPQSCGNITGRAQPASGGAVLAPKTGEVETSDEAH